jgi:hypothetical protein
MVKSNNAPRKRDTHFEQVPIDVAKKVAEQDVAKNKTGRTGRAAVGLNPGKKV